VRRRQLALGGAGGAALLAAACAPAASPAGQGTAPVKKEGLAYPPSEKQDPSWTMEKFLDVAQKLTKPGQQVGMQNVHSSNYLFNRGT
jgi:hypothetical protein